MHGRRDLLVVKCSENVFVMLIGIADKDAKMLNVYYIHLLVCRFAKGKSTTKEKRMKWQRK